MKNMRYILLSAVVSVILAGFTSCEEGDFKTFDTSLSSIYFPQDSIYYSFSTTAIDIRSYTLKVPVKIMGPVSKEKRPFRVELIQEKTNAGANTHYSLPTELFVEADSVNATIPMEILRDELGEDEWKIGLKLTSSTDFQPAPEAGDKIVVCFNNIVSPPNWTDEDGNKVWPDLYLGEWNPIVWLKFLEYFHKMETTVPASYWAMVEKYGKDMEKVTTSWPIDYEFTVKKYILIPMYEEFQANPELGGDTMPNPNESFFDDGEYDNEYDDEEY